MTQSLSSPALVFDAWAKVYDHQPNPLLSLEERMLVPILSDVRGLDVLDAGCGTGRWLQHLSVRGARSLVGIDISPAMLAVAAAKLVNSCELRLGSCMALPASADSADLVLSSFVISYLDDLAGFAGELYRVARPGATVLLADMHPATEAARGWKRSFKTETASTQIPTRRWSLREVTQTFQSLGFLAVFHQEPSFGGEEKHLFEVCGKLDDYLSIEGLPAIYILQLRKPASAPRRRNLSSQVQTLLLTGARCALDGEFAPPAVLSINKESIDTIQDSSRDGLRSPLPQNAIDLSGYMVLPGLINAHDHLEFGLYPNMGKGPYLNAYHWARDIHANWAPLIELHRKLPRSTRLWWGALRNLLCGVTTVCHHNPIYPELLDPSFPIRVVTEFAWAHSLAFDPDLGCKFSRSDLPFVLHAAEGVDQISAQEVDELDRMLALDERTVLVHALACTPAAVALINKRRASVILCPTSNAFLFHQSPSLQFVSSLKSVMLGSDSPLTASGDLLNELRFARDEIGVDEKSLYTMVSTRPAEVLRCRRGEGSLKNGSIADLCIVQDSGLSPSATLAGLTSQQVEMVVAGGRVQMVGASLIGRLPSSSRQGLQCFEVEGQTRWVRAPINKLLTEAEMVLGSDLHLGGKRVRRASVA